MAELNVPVYNSTLKLIRQLENTQAEKCKITIPESEIDRIHEKASVKLNQNEMVFRGLIPVEPDEEEFLKYLEVKYKPKLKPQTSSSKTAQTQKPPDIMEFYPNDLIKEYPSIEIEYVKPAKVQTIQASANIINNPIENYFKWN